jgi:replication initiation protein RepC
MTPGLLKVDRTAENFAGLPPGVDSPGQLLAALKAAASRLGISPRLVHAIDWLFRFTRRQDWEPDARPIVWPSAAMQQAALGLSQTQVKRLNRALIEAGLITMKDSPNGKRYGQRDHKGRIVEAYGFDLSPLTMRHAEFMRVAEEGRAERAAMGRLRRRATIARKAIIQILETADEYSCNGEEWRILAHETVELARSLRGVERLDEMEAGVASLERRQRAARERLEGVLRDVETDPLRTRNEPHQYNYKPTSYPLQDTVITSDTSSGAGDTTVPQSPSSGLAEKPQRDKQHGIRPDELIRLAPKLKPYLRRPDPVWSDLVDAADWLRHDLGISKSLWGEACLAMGRELAAVALAIVSTKEPEHFRTTPGGYFHGMVSKHNTGELHLERTVWALRRAIDPEGYADKRPRSDQRRQGGDAAEPFRQSQVHLLQLTKARGLQAIDFTEGR